MQKRTQKLKNNKKSSKTQKGGLFGLFGNKKKYDVHGAQVKNRQKTPKSNVSLTKYRKISSPVELKQQPHVFSANQEAYFNRLAKEAIAARNANGPVRQKLSPVYNRLTTNNNNGYGNPNAPKPKPPPRITFQGPPLPPPRQTSTTAQRETAF
jgi:hypothetical protein